VTAARTLKKINRAIIFLIYFSADVCEFSVVAVILKGFRGAMKFESHYTKTV
jgi:hypothetical protein